MAPDTRQLASEYIEAVGEGRLDDVAAYLHSAVTWESPGLPTIRGADDYISALRRLSPIIRRNEIKRVFVDGDEACVIYDFVTDTPVGAVQSVEWLTIEGGRIASIRLIFDNARWPEVLERLGLSAATA